MLRPPSPDLARAFLLDVLTEGEPVAVTGVHMFRIEGGLIAEHRGYENLWAVWDAMDGLVPRPASAALG